jgi:phage/plasmid-like protein (TIGR03299 family)
MSRETLTWLNENTLIGFTEKRGRAWHYRQGSDNHFTGPVPVEDVRKRLFDWEAVEQPVILGETVTDADGDPSLVFPGQLIPGRKAIVHPVTGHVFAVVTDSYQIHQYNQWLIDNVETILDDDLQIGSAGLLRRGGVAWVQVEMPETIETPEGVRFRPFLLASTSLDTSISTRYGQAVTATVCDNTLNIARGEDGPQLTIRHSSKSLGRLSEVRDALGIVYTAADEFSRQVADLTATEFTPRNFWDLMNTEVQLPDKKKAAGAYNAAKEKREFLWDLYRFDARVAPWTGTAFGAWQAFNTYEQHENKLGKNVVRAERNMWRAVKGDTAKADTRVLTKILELAS